MGQSSLSKKRTKALLTIIIIFMVGIATYYYPSLSSTVNIANGFSAKNICSGHFISGLSIKRINNEALIPLDNTFNYIDAEIDESVKQVDSTLFGLFKRRAIYRSGLGCTLLTVGQETLETAVMPIDSVEQSEMKPWPIGLAKAEEDIRTIDYELLNQSIENAFNDPSDKFAKGGKRNVNAILVIHKGHLIAEQYAEGIHQKTPLLSWSMAKSITSMQVGLLVKSEQLDLHSKVSLVLWQQKNDARSHITLDQLMRMSSGLEFNEKYGLNSDATRMLYLERETGGFAANKPLQYPPDTFWSYSSGTTNIIAGIVKKAIGGNLQHYYEYTQKQLFQPLGITSAILEMDASDTVVGSSYLYASARDWAKLGQLMLQNGKWNNQQILPDNWVEYSTTPTKTSPYNQYGAQFWLNADPPKDTNKQRKWPMVPADTYYMGGFQGQYVINIPSEELVVVRLGFSEPGVDRGIESLLSDTIKAVNNK